MCVENTLAKYRWAAHVAVGACATKRPLEAPLKILETRRLVLKAAPRESSVSQPPGR